MYLKFSILSLLVIGIVGCNQRDQNQSVRKEQAKQVSEYDSEAFVKKFYPQPDSSLFIYTSFFDLANDYRKPWQNNFREKNEFETTMEYNKLKEKSAEKIRNRGFIVILDKENFATKYNADLRKYFIRLDYVSTQGLAFLDGVDHIINFHGHKAILSGNIISTKAIEIEEAKKLKSVLDDSLIKFVLRPYYKDGALKVLIDTDFNIHKNFDFVIDTLKIISKGKDLDIL